MLKDFLRYFWNKIVLPACGFFTLFLFLVSLAASFSDPAAKPGILLSQAMVILLFSLVLSALNRIFFLKTLHPFIRVGLHFLSYTAALVLIMMGLSGFYSQNGIGPAVFMTIFFLAFYLLVLALFLILRAIGISPIRLPTKGAGGGDDGKTKHAGSK